MSKITDVIMDWAEQPSTTGYTQGVIEVVRPGAEKKDRSIPQIFSGPKRLQVAKTIVINLKSVQMYD